MRGVKPIDSTLTKRSEVTGGVSPARRAIRRRTGEEQRLACELAAVSDRVGADGPQHLYGRPDDLGPDTVAGEQDHVGGHGVGHGIGWRRYLVIANPCDLISCDVPPGVVYSTHRWMLALR